MFRRKRVFGYEFFHSEFLFLNWRQGGVRARTIIIVYSEPSEKTKQEASKTRRARISRREFTLRKRARENASSTPYCAAYSSFSTKGEWKNPLHSPSRFLSFTISFLRLLRLLLFSPFSLRLYSRFSGGFPHAFPKRSARVNTARGQRPSRYTPIRRAR